MTQEKDAIQTIFEIHEMLTALNSKVNILEKNMNLLHNKANSKFFEDLANELPKGKEISIPIKNVDKESIKQPIKAEVKDSNTRSQSVRVFGSFKDSQGNPIHSIDVVILDYDSKIVKSTRTNRSGQWMSFLPPGKYSAEFNKEGMMPSFKNFEITPGQSEFEVS